LQRIGELYGIEEPIRSRPWTNAGPSARRRPSHCWILCDSGSRRPCRSSRASRRRRWRFVRAFALGRIDTLYMKMDTSRLTTTPPNALCVASPWPEELPVCRIRRGWRTCRCDLQPDRFGQAQWSRSRSLSAPGADPYRRPSHQQHRRTAALEPQIHTCRSVHLTYSWTLSKTVHVGRLLGGVP
jgi:hypothetical protein